jgi:hypothetical protein
VVAVERYEQLLTWEWELNSREGAIAKWEDGLAAFDHALGMVRTERDGSHV